MFTREAFHSLYYMLNTGSKTDFRALMSNKQDAFYESKHNYARSQKPQVMGGIRVRASFQLFFFKVNLELVCRIEHK